MRILQITGPERRPISDVVKFAFILCKMRDAHNVFVVDTDEFKSIFKTSKNLSQEEQDYYNITRNCF